MKEAEKRGYVKLYRKAQDDEVFSNPYAWHLFTYCLLNARIRKNRDLDVGEFETSQYRISNDLKMSRKTILKFLKFLKDEGCIDYETDSLRTIIRVLNFSKYQSSKKD